MLDVSHVYLCLADITVNVLDVQGTAVGRGLWLKDYCSASKGFCHLFIEKIIAVLHKILH